MIRQLTNSFIIFFMMHMALPAFALEDRILSTEGKLTDIKIEDNKIIDVCPLVTIMNDKNTLIVHPLKTGNTRFCVLKNDKDIVMFNVKVTEEETIVDELEGFEIFSLDLPPEDFELDTPPEGVKQNG